jgi:hypothetical protein
MRIMTFAGKWSIRKRDIVAPEQMDRLPILSEWKPNVVNLPNRKQVCQSIFLTKTLLLSIILSWIVIKHRILLFDQSEIIAIMRWMADPKQRMGHR